MSYFILLCLFYFVYFRQLSNVLFYFTLFETTRCSLWQELTEHNMLNFGLWCSSPLSFWIFLLHCVDDVYSVTGNGKLTHVSLLGEGHLNYSTFLKAYSQISYRGRSQKFQNLNLLHLFVAFLPKVHFPNYCVREFILHSSPWSRANAHKHA